MTEFESKQHVCFIADKLGIVVQDIPRSDDDLRPDFEFFCDDECTLVELKSREGDWHFTGEEENQLDSGEIVERSESIGRHNTISGRIKKAHRQLSSFASSRHSFRLLWFCASGTFAELVFEQVRSTLLGDLTVYESDSDRQWRAFFFDDSQFYRYKDSLDGAIISVAGPSESRAQLILNPLSPRYSNFKSSRIVQAFSSGLLDPITIEDDGEGLIVGSEADRTSEDGKLLFLASHYGIQDPFIIRMGHHAAILRPE